MVVLDKLTVLPLKIDKIRVSWKFQPTFESFQDYSITLEKSKSPEDGFELVHTVGTTPEFVDPERYKRLWKSIYYRMKIVHTPSGKEVVSEPVRMSYEPNMEALEIIRRNDILLKNKRHGVGVPMAVFLRVKDGFHCECWDKEKKRSRSSRCLDCLQTGWSGGYYDPIIEWVNSSPENKTVAIPQWGETEPAELQLMVSNYPVLEPKDVLFDPVKFTMMMVENVKTSERRGHLLHQILSVTYMDRNNILYKLLDRHTNLMTELDAARGNIELA